MAELKQKKSEVAKGSKEIKAHQEEEG